MSEAPALKTRLVRIGAALMAVAAMAVLVHTLHRSQVPRFIHESPQAFATLLEAPSAADSRETRVELNQLLMLQAERTPADVAAAQADRKTRISRFADALGLAPQKVD